LRRMASAAGCTTLVAGLGWPPAQPRTGGQFHGCSSPCAHCSEGVGGRQLRRCMPAWRPINACVGDAVGPSAGEHASQRRVDSAARAAGPGAVPTMSEQHAGSGSLPRRLPPPFRLRPTRRLLLLRLALPQVDETSARLPSPHERGKRRCSDLHAVDSLLRLPKQYRIGQRPVPDRCGMLVHIRNRLASKLLLIKRLPKWLHPLLGL